MNFHEPISKYFFHFSNSYLFQYHNKGLLFRKYSFSKDFISSEYLSLQIVSGLITKKGLSLNSFAPFFTPPPVSNNKSFSFDILILTSDLRSEISSSI